MRLVGGLVIAGLLPLLFGCRSGSGVEQSAQPIFRLISSEESGLDFSNDLPVELELNIFNYMYYYNGGGTATADFNGDGLMDLYFTSNLGKDKLYLNEGDLRFRDVSDQLSVDGGMGGWTTGASVADLNGDGLPDIYLSQVGRYRDLDSRNMLFLSTGVDDEGIPQFREAAQEVGLDFSGFSTQAGFFDYDRDGDLDCFLMNHSLHHNGTFGQRKTFLDKVDPISGDKLFRNDNGRFVDVTGEAGIISATIGYGLGLAFGDLNLDGWPDIYVGNDFHENDYLYLNQGDGTFKESVTESMGHTSRFSMGVDIADLNGDAFPEVISLDMLPEDPVILKRSEGEDALDIFDFKLGYGYNHQYARNCLQLNQGNGLFTEVGLFADVFATDWSWTPLFFDMNLDGQQDLFISNGIPKRMNDIDYIDFMTGNDLQFKIQFDQLDEEDIKAIEQIPEIKLENKFFLGGEGLQFEDATARVTAHEVSYSNSAVAVDLDGDGDLEVVANNIDQQVFLYENLSANETASSFRIDLRGPENNRDAIGSKVLVYQRGKLQAKEQFQVRGFQSSMLTPLTFTRTAENLDSVVVIWPDGSCSRRSSGPAEDMEISFGAGLAAFNYDQLRIPAIVALKSVGEELGIEVEHVENPFVEFNREVLIPHSVSSEGPALAVADLNADGLEDFYVGSSKRKRSHIYLQTAEGSFVELPQPELWADSTYEEVDARLTDVNADGHPDLVIATGGNEFRLTSEFTQPLLYLNDGGGLMSRKTDAFEQIHLTASCLEIMDLNADGHPDLFLGARTVPRAYGEAPKSEFLINDGTGKFSRSQVLSRDFRDLGFVRDSEFIPGDDLSSGELILATEWGGVEKLSLRNSKLKASTVLDYKGWWSYVKALDADGDGDMDLLLGNQGLNHRFSPSKEEPVRMYYQDFDDNGNKEQLLTYYLNGRELPFHNKKELEKQIPLVKKKFVKASDFAQASLEEIFDPAKLKEPYVAEEFRSMICIRQDNGDYMPIWLPEEAQYSPLRAAIDEDFDGDGIADLVVFGNFHDANVQMGRYDGNYGTLLLASGAGPYLTGKLGGDAIKGQVRQILPISIAGERHYLIGRNAGSLKVIRFESTD